MIISLIVLHFLLGAGIVAAGDRLGRRGFALGTLGPAATAIWLFSNLGTIVNGGEEVQSLNALIGPQLSDSHLTFASTHSPLSCSPLSLSSGLLSACMPLPTSGQTNQASDASVVFS